MARDDLEREYEQEREYLHKLGDEFGRAHPKVAGRLRLGKQGSTDPHVERLIDAVAFLNARLRRKLDDDFPELTDALLGFLYPHLAAPVPSLSIVRFACDPALPVPYEVKAGTLLDTDPVDGEPLRFRTCWPATLRPIDVALAGVLGPHAPRPAAGAGEGARARSVLRLALESAGDAALAPLLFPKSGGAAAGRLRFFLHGEASVCHDLHELLFNDALELLVATGADDPAPQRLPASALEAVGFAAGEGLLPLPPRSHPAYRLLTELFQFPAKFLFVDVAGLDPAKVAACGRRVELFVPFRRASPKVEQDVDARTFALGCTPIVNLFARRAEPIRLVEGEHEHRIVPDARRARSLEVWSIDRVVASTAGARPVEYLPLHGIDHGTGDADRGRFWSATRRASPGAGERGDRGCDVWLSLVDLDRAPAEPADWVLDVETTCFNRDLPALLPFGGGQPRLRFHQGGGPVQRIECLLQPTPTRRPALREGAAWQLVSQLNLNHLSLGSADAGEAEVEAATEAFRELLRLHFVEPRDELEALVRGVASIRTRPATLRIAAGGAPGLCRGNEISLVIDEARFPSRQLFLFGSVVERFLALHAGINSFVRTSLSSTAREGVVRRFPARAGDRGIE